MSETKHIVENDSLVEAEKKDGQDEENSSKDKLSIQQILEGMTNEFNKTGSKKQVDSVRKINKIDSPTRKQELSPIKSTEETTVKNTKSIKCSHNIEDEIKIIKENIPETKSDKSTKDEESTTMVNKKDGNIPRIVLTFRTIDENTDHGKKTKISSCTSNLSLVPDELVNCDQISGVSVKIENFEEVHDSVNKLEKEDGGQSQSVKKNNTLPIINKEDKVQNSEKRDTKKETSSSENPKLKAGLNSESKQTINDKIVIDKSQEEMKSISSTTRKRQRRLRELRL